MACLGIGAAARPGGRGGDGEAPEEREALRIVGNTEAVVWRRGWRLSTPRRREHGGGGGGGGEAEAGTAGVRAVR